jgi:AcrR family transcriptional regulator
MTRTTRTVSSGAGARPTRRAAPTTPPSLRDRHNDATKELILDALVAQLSDTGPFEFSYFEVARRAGVSVRTVYRHFPTRESLFEAIGRRINERVGMPTYPDTADGVVALPRSLFPAFDRVPQLIRAQMKAGFGSEVRAHARRERLAMMQQAVKQIAGELSPERRTAAGGLLSCLLSADVWARLADECGLDGAQSGEIVSWAIDTLMRALAAENERARRTRRRDHE